MKLVKKTGKNIISLIYITVAFILYSVVQALFMLPKSKALTLSLIMYISAMALAILVLVYGFYQRQLNLTNQRHFTSFKKERMTKFNLKSLRISAIGLLLIFGFQMLFNFMPSEAINQAQINAAQKSINPYTSSVMLVLIAPLFEEIIFRGLFFNFFFKTPFQSKKEHIFALFANGLLFGLAHEPELDAYTIFYVIAGMILAEIYLRTKDLSYSFFAHFGNNLLVMLLNVVV